MRFVSNKKEYMKTLGRLRLIVGSVLFLSALGAYGATAPQRIVTAIDGAEVATVPGSVRPEVRRATDLGRVAANTALTQLSLRFNISAAQQAGLGVLLSEQQNPASPRYHQWLTPEQFGAQFGLPAADLAKVSAWLASQGFTVTEVARGGTFMRFTGTVGQAEAAFHTQLHQLSVDGETHIANVSDPSLPAAMAAVTSSIGGLHDFQLKPRVKRVPAAVTPTDATVRPLYTSQASGNHFLAPADFWTIYDYVPSSGMNGAGVTVAVMGQTDIVMSDVTTFRSLGGLPTYGSAGNPTFTVKVVGTDPGTRSADQLEAELDVEWSGATAPNANILFVNSTAVIDTSLTCSIDNNLAPILSLSYGECEAAAGSAAVSSFVPLFEQANAQGQTIVASAGDSGATDCDYNVTIATKGLGVDFPGDIPNVTSIGGTMFNDASGTYWNATNSSANNGSALTYIPEQVWNEDSQGQLGSGGGGASLYMTKPLWQVGTGVPADSARDVPDVSLNAALFHDAVLICTPGFCLSGTYKDASGSHDIVGGTSVGAPEFAGILALIEQKTGSRIGNANPTLYALANSALYSTAFHDITSGNNSSPCTAGTTNCPIGGSIGFSAGTGYDLASGWGSLKVTGLVNSWALVTPLLSAPGQTISAVNLTSDLTSVTQGTALHFTAKVTSGTSANTSTPTGTVQFLLDNVAQGAPVALVAGTATFTLNTTSVAYGVRSVAAAYSGDATFLGERANESINITSSGTPDFALTPSTGTVTVTSGLAGAPLTFTVTGINSFAGNVTLTASAVTGASYVLSPSVILLSNSKMAGTSTLVLNAFASLDKPAMPAGRGRPAWYESGSGVALAGLLMFMLPRRRRFVGALVAVLSVGMLLVSGCGGGGSAQTTTTSNGTARGTYTVTVTASGASTGGSTVTHTSTVTFVVQ